MNIADLNTNGLILLFVGLLLRFLIGRRRFRRRNHAGVEVFSSYMASQIILLFEGVFNLLGLFMIICGIVAVLVG